MLQFIRDHKLAAAGVGALLLAGVAWLAFGYFGVQYLFIDDEVDEALPEFDVPAPGAPLPAAATDDAIDSDQPVADGPTTGETTPAPDTVPPTAVDATPTPEPPPTAAPPVAEIVTEYTASFVGDAHPAVGTAVVLGNGTGQRFLRFEEDFETDNGPDLNVYLVRSAAGGATDFVDLGDLTGNVGSQNYEIPAHVDLEVYDRVYVWCVRFGVGFGYADLMPA